MAEGKNGRCARSIASRRLWGLIAAAVVLSAAAPVPVAKHAPSVDRFDTVFAVAGEPAALHYRADYGGAGRRHVVEVWRDRDRRLKRVTDAAVETYVVHRSDGDFNMLVVDHRKRIVTEVGRTSLYRLGNFTDWFDLAHGLRHPKETYRLVAVASGNASTAELAAASKPVDRCQFYDLIEATRTTRVCWSARDRLPLLMLTSSGAVIWRVTAIDRTPLANTVFRVPDKGYVRINANRDAERD